MAVDEAHDYDILLACPRGLDAQQILIDFDPNHDRTQHPDQSLEKAIENVWQQKKTRNPSLYNGSKFRYAGFDVLESASQKEPKGPAELALMEKQVDTLSATESIQKIRLKLGLSDYRTFVGTNLSEQWTSFLASADGASGTSDAQRCRHLADPLGNAALVRTADGQALLLQRGEAVGEFPNHPVFPGGHPEPVEVGISSHGDVIYPEEKQQRSTLIGLEMFEGIVREVEEETGAPATSLSNLKFVGLVRRKQNARPVGMFVCDCSLTAAEVQDKYQHAEHKFESTRLRAVPCETLWEEAQGMPGCHKGGCALALAFLEHQQPQGTSD